MRNEDAAAGRAGLQMPLGLRSLVRVGSVFRVRDDDLPAVIAPLPLLDEFEHRVDVVHRLGQ